MSVEPALEMPPEAAAKHATSGGQGSAKRARRPRQPAPKRRTPRGAIRRFNGLVAKLAAERGAGALGVVEFEMVRQAAAMMLRAEQLQAGIVNGEEIDPNELIRLSSEGRRILRSIRIGAKPGASPPPPWSPLRAKLNAAAGASAPALELEEATS
jgi:hypothetical protein